jgi:6-hydroxycyclohex-1-ene-1-carbonyl-CoA dehydrogenase
MKQLKTWEMRNQGEAFALAVKPLPELKPGEVRVKVAGCGVCHTDLSFWHDGVRTRHELPLTLGHEISGTVVEGDPGWLGAKVIVPAVLPCGECELCKKGRSNICQKQLMPGNDFDGGFASHVSVPSRFLCRVPDEALKRYSLEELAVVADAISTPYQAIRHAGLEAGDFVIVIGVGGIGIYAAMLAKVFGAKVLGLDLSDEKLAIATQNGADAVLNIKDMEFKALRKRVNEIAAELGASPYGWKIFEMSGTAPGQETAFGLLSYAGTLSVVGFTMDRLNLRLSNLMAFDAKAIGTWGCKPELYPEVMELVANGKLNLKPFVQTIPMSEINQVFQNTLAHKYTKRTVLVADFEN